MERTILHCDMNNFYASVECMKQPNLKNIPMAIAGNKELRHGIILAKNQIAKEQGIETGQTIWAAQQQCMGLHVLPPDFPEYQRYSRMVKEIFAEYTDRVEDFGIDESWLDVSESTTLFGDGKTIAQTIQKRIYQEIGLSSSIGVSYNKIFAKLGSDFKKPMGITVITKDNFKDMVWSLPVGDLLYVGQSTVEKLYHMGIHTIGELACANYGKLKQSLGKWGEYLWTFANGEDKSEVAKQAFLFPVKSIGNGITPPRDIHSLVEFRLLAYVLCESIIARMREQHCMGRCIQLHIRTTTLVSYSRQITFKTPIYTVQRMVDAAVALCAQQYSFEIPLRTISISITQLTKRDAPIQLSMFDEDEQKEEEKLDVVMEDIRHRFGNFSIRRCSMKQNVDLTSFDPLNEHTIHPVNFFR